MNTWARNPDELKVFVSSSDSTCEGCGDDLARGAWIIPLGDRKVLCLSCGDLDHLEFLPSGSAALTRRSRKHSALSAIVLKWSRARKRFERQGILVEADALEQAERECLADAEIRMRRRFRDAERRAEQDRKYIQDFAARVRELYPKCPWGREIQIASHACRKYSGRVGRSASAKNLDPATIRLAVVAHIRHAETEYDTLLAETGDRCEERAAIDGQVHSIVNEWQGAR
jgi:hypothetical protein